MPKRKTVQIAVTAIPSTLGQHDQGWALVALCDDGTVWDFDYHTQSWTAIPAIPQSSEAPDAA
jgi:hypothetical protein